MNDQSSDKVADKVGGRKLNTAMPGIRPVDRKAAAIKKIEASEVVRRPAPESQPQN